MAVRPDRPILTVLSLAVLVAAAGGAEAQRPAPRDEEGTSERTRPESRSDQARRELSDRHAQRRAEADPHARDEWWKGLTPEEQEKYRERYERMKSMTPEQRAELGRRFEQLRHMREEFAASITEEEESALAEMSEGERRAWLERRWKQMLEERADRARREDPELDRKLREKPVDQRLNEGGRRHDQMRKKWLSRRASKLVEDGYLGERILERLEDEDTTAEEFMPVVFEAQKRKVLDEAGDDRFAEWKLDTDQERSLRALPGREFHLAWRMLESGASYEEALEASRDFDAWREHMRKRGAGRHGRRDGDADRRGDHADRDGPRSKREGGRERMPREGKEHRPPRRRGRPPR